MPQEKGRTTHEELVALFLMLAMMMACVPAMALEVDAVFGQFDNDNAGSWAPPYDHSVWKKLYGFDLKQTANITAKVYDANV